MLTIVNTKLPNCVVAQSFCASVIRVTIHLSGPGGVSFLQRFAKRRPRERPLMSTFSQGFFEAKLPPSEEGQDDKSEGIAPPDNQKPAAARPPEKVSTRGPRARRLKNGCNKPLMWRKNIKLSANHRRSERNPHKNGLATHLV